MHVVAGDASSAHLDRKPKIGAARHVSRKEREGETPPSKREKKGELAFTACMVVGESVHTHRFYMWRDKKGDRAQTKNPSQTGKKDGEGHRTTLRNRENPAIAPKLFALLDLCVKIVNAGLQSKTY